MKENQDNAQLSCRGLTPVEMTRRSFLTKLSLGLGALCSMILGLPVVGFVFAPLFRKSPVMWITLGKTEQYQVGQTVCVTIADPSPLPWAGITARTSAWLRRETEDQFVAFSVNCTHMGCPVRWLPEAQLFMCPCHGGVYYSDGTVAAGPPPKPLIRYDLRLMNGEVQIKASAIPITTTL